MMCPSDDVFLPNITAELSFANDSVILKVSNPSISSSQVTNTYALPSVAPASIVMLNELEVKSLPVPVANTYTCNIAIVILYTAKHSRGKLS